MQGPNYIIQYYHFSSCALSFIYTYYNIHVCMYAGSYRYSVQNKFKIKNRYQLCTCKQCKSFAPQNYRYPLAQRTDIYQCLLIENLIAKITVKHNIHPAIEGGGRAEKGICVNTCNI